MENQPNHKARVRTYAILAKVFIPLGIVCVSIGIVLLAVSTPFLVQAIIDAPNSSDCIVTQNAIRCTGEMGFRVAMSALGFSLGFIHTLLGLPMLIIGPIFRNRARVNRKVDEDAGVDYGDFPYGK